MASTEELLKKDIHELYDSLAINLEVVDKKVEAIIHYKIIQQYIKLYEKTAGATNEQAKRLTCATWTLVFVTVVLAVATVLPIFLK